MTFQRKAPAVGDGKGSQHNYRDDFDHSTNNMLIALRSAIWAVVRSSHPNSVQFGFVFERLRAQGFAPAKVRDAIEGMATNGALEFCIGQEGRIFVRIAQGGRGDE